MRRNQQKSSWWTTPLGYVIAIGMVFAAIWPGTYVTDHLSAWAAPIVWIALAVGGLACAGYYTSKLNGYLVCGILGFTLSLAFGISMVEGWGAQVKIALDLVKVALLIGSAALFIGLVVFSVRMTRHVYRPMRADLRTIGEAIHTDALFRDDGERIITHPARLRLLGYVVAQVAIIGACAFGIRWAVSQSENPLILAAVGFLTAFLALLAILYTVRLILRGPTLVIGPDGLLDSGSQIVTGRGLLRWDEIVMVFEYTYKPQKFGPTSHMLAILLTDAVAVSARQAFAKRALGFIGRGQLPNTIVLVRALIDQPTDALAEQIRRYARSHAPRGWDSPLIATDDDEESEP
ncbi:MAG TPA: hypothetical protein VFN78_10230 [Ktedonobacterales bacterium]|nr:hypothetical protein [Ktedonobacterales bacterium]